jgi:hypothetical protein
MYKILRMLNEILPAGLIIIGDAFSCTASSNVTKSQFYRFGLFHLGDLK